MIFIEDELFNNDSLCRRNVKKYLYDEYNIKGHK